MVWLVDGCLMMAALRLYGLALGRDVCASVWRHRHGLTLFAKRISDDDQL